MSRFPFRQHPALLVVGLLLRITLLLGSGGALPGAHVAAATSYTVNALTDTGAGSGTTGDLRYAINQVNAGGGGDTIQITATGTITLTQGTLTLAKNVTITGPGPASLAIDGGCTFSGGRCTSGGVTVFTVNQDVTVNMSGLTIQHGNATVTCFQVYLCGGGISNNGTLTVTNSTLINNYAGTNGGGITNQGTLTAINSTFSGNTTGDRNGDGGGIFTFSPNDQSPYFLTVTNSTFSGNIAGNGAGVYLKGVGTVTNSTFSGNQMPANSGGAGGAFLVEDSHSTLTVRTSVFSGNATREVLGNDFATLTVTDSTFSHNAGYGIGSSGTLTVAGSTFNDNTDGGPANSGIGGGGLANTGKGAVTNSTFVHNTSSNPGGGILNTASATLTVTNSTVAGNSAPQGGGILNETRCVVHLTCPPSTVNLTNTIVAENTGGDLANSNLGNMPGSFVGFDNLIDDAASAAGFTDGTNGNIVGHPALLGTLGNYGGPTQTIPLLSGSPAIDAGAAVGQGPPGNTVPATDQRDFPRVGAPDIGSYEVQSNLMCGGGTALSIKVGQTVACNTLVQSSDPTIVAADGNGNITGVRAGQATITATQGSVPGTVTVTVVAPTPIGLSVPPAPQSRPSGTTGGSGSPSPAPAPRSVPGAAPVASPTGPTPNPAPPQR